MNNSRRKEIDNVIKDLNDVYEKIDLIQDEEQDYVDNIPENLQASEKYEVAEEAVFNLDSAKDAIDDAISYLKEAKGE